MKKIVALGVLILGAVATLFYGVLTKEEPQIQKSEERVTKVRFGYNIPEESVLHQAAVRFAEKVKAKTNGRVVVELYPNQILGNDHMMLEMARMGELDMVMIPTAKMSVAVPAMQYADLPFYFHERQDVYDMIDGEVGRMLLEKLSTVDLVGVTIWDNGFKHFTGNAPLLTPEDFIGKKIRVMKSRILMEQFRLLGASPVAIDFHETRNALKDNVVDGQENPLVAIYTMDIHTAQTNLALSEHAFLGYVLSISAKTYEKLPVDCRQVLVETALETTSWERENTKQKEREFLEKIAASGIKIDTLDPHQKERFRVLMENIPRKFESLIGSDIISKSQELLYKKYKNENAEVVIGFDGDLSAEIDKGNLALKRGIELAIDEVNAKGGLFGKKVVLVAKDNRALASRGVENVRDLLNFPNLIAFAGGVHSAIIYEQLNQMQEKTPPVLLGWSGNVQLTETHEKRGHVFRVSVNDKTAAHFIVEEALRRSDRISIVYENSIWGRDNFMQMQSYLQSQGKNCIEGIPFNRGESDFANKIDALYANGTEVLVMVANPKESVSLVHEIAKRKEPLPIVSHWGVVGGEFFAQTKHLLPQIDLRFLQTFVASDAVSQKAKGVLARYEATYEDSGEEGRNLAFALLQSYDATQLFFSAVEKAGSFEHAKMIEALESLESHEGAMKRYESPFAKGKPHEALAKEDYKMARFTPEGKIVAIEGR
ncbi:MAG: DctP family TRAP transporter solute-binding subunit [Sulfurimonadaceae bacterium]